MRNEMNKHKEIYRDLCRKKRDIPLFMQADWLDVVCGDNNWQVALAQDDQNSVIAAWPYYMQSWHGLEAITMPMLTPFTGIWMSIDQSLPTRKKYQLEEEVLDKLISQLPPHKSFEQRFHYTMQNWLPFYWNGYKQQTRYTFEYNTCDFQKIYNGFGQKLQTNINQASKSFIIKEYSDLPVMYDLIREVFSSRKKPMPYSYTFLEGIDTLLDKKNQRQMYFAMNEHNEAVAGVYIVWDSTTAYYLLSGRNEHTGNKSVNALLLWHSIREASNRGLRFNFEGSMLPGVYQFFRGFGAERKSYYFVSKYRSFARIKQLK
jgi:hypothetical protein